MRMELPILILEEVDLTIIMEALGYQATHADYMANDAHNKLIKMLDKVRSGEMELIFDREKRD